MYIYNIYIIYTYIYIYYIYTSRSPPPTWAAHTPYSYPSQSTLKSYCSGIHEKNPDLYSVFQTVIRSC